MSSNLPALITAIAAAVATGWQAFRSWQRHQASAQVAIDDRLDARVVREFDRMEVEIEKLREEARMLRTELTATRERVWILERHLEMNDVPLPEGGETSP